MNYTSLLVKSVASMLFTASFTVTPVVAQDPLVPVNEYPVTIVATTTSKQVAVVRKPAVHEGDCAKYASLINEYDWATSTALEVCKHESRGDPKAVGDGDTEHVSCGLMQIRTLPGRPSCEELSDPKINLEYAYKLWKREGWRPWSVCRDAVDCE